MNNMQDGNTAALNQYQLDQDKANPSTSRYMGSRGAQFLSIKELGYDAVKSVAKKDGVTVEAILHDVLLDTVWERLQHHIINQASLLLRDCPKQTQDEFDHDMRDSHALITEAARQLSCYAQDQIDLN